MREREGERERERGKGGGERESIQNKLYSSTDARSQICLLIHPPSPLSLQMTLEVIHQKLYQYQQSHQVLALSPSSSLQPCDNTSEPVRSLSFHEKINEINRIYSSKALSILISPLYLYH